MIDEELLMSEAAATSDVPEGEETLAERSGPTRAEKAEAAKAMADFDLKAFIAGVRPGRVSYKLYARPDLDAEATRVRQALWEATNLHGPASARVKSLQRELKDVQAAYFAQSIEVVIEERSADWQAAKQRELKDAGVTADRDVTFGLVAAQIVEPAGFTGQDLTDLYASIPGQIAGLVKAWAGLHSIDPEGLPVF